MDAIVPAMLANALVAIGLMAVAFGVAAARRPRAAHAAWLVVLVKLVAPPLVVIPVVWVAARAAAEPQPKSAPAPEPAFPVLPPPTAAEPIPVPIGEAPNAEPTRDGANVTVEPTPVLPEFAAGAPLSEPLNPWRIAFYAWFSGAVVWVGFVALRVVRFRRFVATATPVDGETSRLAREVAARLGLSRIPEVSFVGGPVSPMLWAVVGRPRVLLPRRLWANFDPDQREAVLAHELAHLVRGDHWTRRFELVVLAIYWWCPVAWVAVRELRRAEEACCDARVLGAVPGRAAAYAEALVETIAFVNRPGWVPLASGGAARATDLKRRVTMILNSTGGPRATPWLVTAVVLVGVAVLPLAPGLADEPKPAPEELVASVEDPPPAVEPPPATWRVVPASNGRYWAVERQEPPAPLPQPGWTPSRVSRADSTSLKDEVELLEAQMDVKQAHVRAAERGVKSAERLFAQIKEAGSKGAAAASEVARVEEAYEKAISELEIRKAELQEHAVRVNQAKRRLTADATSSQPTRPNAYPSPSPAARSLPPTRNADPASAPTRPAPVPVPPTAERADPAPRTMKPAPTLNRAANDSAADQRAALAKRMNDMMDQYEQTQKDIQRMQKQQAELKKLLDDLAAEEKKLNRDQPTPARR